MRDYLWLFMVNLMTKISDRPASRYAQQAVLLLGDSIRVARIERNLTMAETAERAGISRALLRRIERGDPGAAVGSVLEAASVVGVPLFETDRNRLATHLAHTSEKLTLLPKLVRPRRGEAVKDEF